MSDDEYYYDSSYEDLHDILYDADPSPELADDLAEHALYSPVWQENPAAELQTYFSDWEYYSDDYYDDDPKIPKENPQDGSIEQKKGEKRGRKRKLAETQKSGYADNEETSSLVKCIQGTVWARSPKLKPRSYKQGDMDKVALKLSDAVMRSAYSYQKGFGKARLRRDDSWANDLSLADMGLMNERRKSSQQDMQFGTEDADEEDENEHNLEHLRPLDALEEGMIAENNPDLPGPETYLATSDGRKAASQAVSQTTSSSQNESRSTKRKKLNHESKILPKSLLSTTLSIASATSDEPSVSSTTLDDDTITEMSEQVRQSPEVSASESQVHNRLPARNRKRKMDADPSETGSDADDDNVRPISKTRRAKRAAVEKLATVSKESKEPQSRPLTRTTRRSKK